jgi:hypothetical protein
MMPTMNIRFHLFRLLYLYLLKAALLPSPNLKSIRFSGVGGSCCARRWRASIYSCDTLFYQSYGFEKSRGFDID